MMLDQTRVLCYFSIRWHVPGATKMATCHTGVACTGIPPHSGHARNILLPCAPSFRAAPFHAGPTQSSGGSNCALPGPLLAQILSAATFSNQIPDANTRRTPPLSERRRPGLGDPAGQPALGSQRSSADSISFGPRHDGRRYGLDAAAWRCRPGGARRRDGCSPAYAPPGLRLRIAAHQSQHQGELRPVY